jgi:hypothetical protein
MRSISSNAATALATIVLGGCAANFEAVHRSDAGESTRHSARETLFQPGSPTLDGAKLREIGRLSVWITAANVRGSLTPVPTEELSSAYALRVPGHLRQLTVRDSTWVTSDSSHSYTDEFGNMIEVGRSPFAPLLGGGAPTVRVAFPICIGSAGEGLIKRSFDLRPIGGPLLREVFEDRPVVPDPGSAAAYSPSLFPVETSLREQVGAMLYGAREVERLFGRDSGTFVRMCYVVDSKFIEAGCRTTEPQVFVVSTGAFAVLGKSLENAIVAGRHEGIHLADAALGFPSRNSGIVKLMEDIRRSSPQFFEVVNEGSWSAVSAGGHSRDSSAEFFASTLNALLDESGVAAVRSYDPALLERCAAAFLEALQSTPDPVPETVPIISALRSHGRR